MRLLYEMIMGAAKIPEQIAERAHEAALDADHKSHPSIEALKAKPVQRRISSDDKPARPVKPSAIKSRKRVARRMAIDAISGRAWEEIKQIRGLIERLSRKASSNPLDANLPNLMADIAFLKNEVRRRQSAILSKKNRKRRRKKS